MPRDGGKTQDAIEGPPSLSSSDSARPIRRLREQSACATLNPRFRRDSPTANRRNGITERASDSGDRLDSPRFDRPFVRDGFGEGLVSRPSMIPSMIRRITPAIVKLRALAALPHFCQNASVNKRRSPGRFHSVGSINSGFEEATCDEISPR